MRGIQKSGVKFVIATGLVITPYQPWITLNIILISFSFISMTFFLYVGAISLYYARSNLMTFVEIAHAFSIVASVYIVLFIHFAIKLPMTHEVYQMVDHGIFTYKTRYGEGDDKKLRDKMKFYQNLFQNVFYVAIIAILCVLGVLTPFLIKFFGNKDGEQIAEINYDLPIPLWLPFKTDTLLGYSVAYAFVFCEVAMICIYLSSALPFIVFVIFEIHTQYSILKRSILNLEHRALERYNLSGKMSEQRLENLREDRVYANCVQECLKENILHHLEILRTKAEELARCSAWKWVKKEEEEEEEEKEEMEQEEKEEEELVEVDEVGVRKEEEDEEMEDEMEQEEEKEVVEEEKEEEKEEKMEQEEKKEEEKRKKEKKKKKKKEKKKKKKQ
ncbi:hypothetical protein LSTR_LSTR005943 [Laodelphax striatellus]|uniref:Odorant receptor n=1 Tax=Laodelphax striatellus TaxID=195883 RepID=A0A482WES1_LAOST|nr:hypothetical protein LSTR_LSTR005943 [Laodelphax striatellus]